MAAVWGWQFGEMWMAVEVCPPYRMIGIYPSHYSAAQRAIDFGSPAEVYPVCNIEAAKAIANMVRIRRGGR
jgi:hypothetical protein